jgi:dolichyl-phosphate beta-glucosyltransferase
VSALRPSTGSEDVHLTVILPAYDEVSRIGASVTRVLAYLDSRPYPSELIVVLDGGRPGADRAIADATRGRDSSNRVTVLDNGQNRGKGFSVRRGVAASRGRYVIFADADLSLPIEDADRFLDVLEKGADIAIGSRVLPESTAGGVPQPMRQWLSRAFNWTVRHLVVGGLRDTQCGFKAFEGARGRALFRRQRLDGFAFDVEILRIAERSAYRVAEVPVACEYHRSSSVRRFRHGASMLLDLLRIRWHDACGRYDASR